MFTPEERDDLRFMLLEHAKTDRSITGAAITGSASIGREDEWSDIDLAFGVKDVADLPVVISDWTGYMYESHHALHHTDVLLRQWTYRVFLLPTTLQVDLAFGPATDFRATAPSFRLVCGEALESQYLPSPPIEQFIGLGWLYALHARTCIARRRLWQAEYMISGVRDNALALACLRQDLPTAHGRGVDLLPREVAAKFEGSLVRQLDITELSRAFRVVIEGLLSEICSVDKELAERLKGPLTALAEPVD